MQDASSQPERTLEEKITHGPVRGEDSQKFTWPESWRSIIPFRKRKDPKPRVDPSIFETPRSA